MRKLNIFFIGMMLMATLGANGQECTKATVKDMANGFISTLMGGDLKGTLKYFDPGYVAEQHDGFLEGRTEQFVAEFLSGNYKDDFVTPQLDRIKSMKVTKTCCNLVLDDIYADVKIQTRDGVKYIVRLRLRVTETGELRFFGAMG